MLKRSLLRLCLLGLAAMLLAPAGALAATKAPSIKSVSPKKLAVGQVLTIRGSGFKAGRSKNTVVFRSDGLHVRVKAYSATRSRLKVRVPASLQAYMKRRGSRVLSTRFAISVVPSKGRASKYTPRRLSPVVQPADTPAGQTPGGTPKTGAPSAPAAAPSIVDCNFDGVDDSLTSDDDGDLLPDEMELGFVHPTNPCKADSDFDGVDDGFEYYSAQDLNNENDDLPPNTPYPGKRHYPNPLFSDAGTDYDGDSLTLREEYMAWVKYSDDGVARTGAPTLPLNYSDGSQTSSPKDPGLHPWYMNFDSADGSTILSDNERDTDGDGLTNYDEAHGRATYGFWKAAYDQERDYWLVPFVQLDWLDPDTDGDGVLDGDDDQDHDDLTNVEELDRGAPPFDFDYGNPYNPCLPNPASRTCTRHPPFSNPPAPFDCSLPVDGSFPEAPFGWAGNKPGCYP